MVLPNPKKPIPMNNIVHIDSSNAGQIKNHDFARLLSDIYAPDPTFEGLPNIEYDEDEDPKKTWRKLAQRLANPFIKQTPVIKLSTLGYEPDEQFYHSRVLKTLRTPDPRTKFKPEEEELNKLTFMKKPSFGLDKCKRKILRMGRFPGSTTVSVTGRSRERIQTNNILASSDQLKLKITEFLKNGDRPLVFHKEKKKGKKSSLEGIKSGNVSIDYESDEEFFKLDNMLGEDMIQGKRKSFTVHPSKYMPKLGDTISFDMVTQIKKDLEKPSGKRRPKSPRSPKSPKSTFATHNPLPILKLDEKLNCIGTDSETDSSFTETDQSLNENGEKKSPQSSKFGIKKYFRRKGKCRAELKKIFDLKKEKRNSFSNPSFLDEFREQLKAGTSPNNLTPGSSKQNTLTPPSPNLQKQKSSRFKFTKKETIYGRTIYKANVAKLNKNTLVKEEKSKDINNSSKNRSYNQSKFRPSESQSFERKNMFNSTLNGLNSYIEQKLKQYEKDKDRNIFPHTTTNASLRLNDPVLHTLSTSSFKLNMDQSKNQIKTILNEKLKIQKKIMESHRFNKNKEKKKKSKSKSRENTARRTISKKFSDNIFQNYRSIKNLKPLSISPSVDTMKEIKVFKIYGSQSVRHLKYISEPVKTPSFTSIENNKTKNQINKNRVRPFHPKRIPLKIKENNFKI